MVLNQQPYHRWYSERHINAKFSQEKSPINGNNRMESDSMISPFSTSSSLLNNKPSYTTCNMQFNSNSNSNSSISNNFVTNSNIAKQHETMENSIINNTSKCSNKRQLALPTNANTFLSNETNDLNVNDDIKEENPYDYKSHLMDDSQKFNLILNDRNRSIRPINVSQVRNISFYLLLNNLEHSAGSAVGLLRKLTSWFHRRDQEGK